MCKHHGIILHAKHTTWLSDVLPMMANKTDLKVPTRYLFVCEGASPMKDTAIVLRTVALWLPGSLHLY